MELTNLELIQRGRNQLLNELRDTLAQHGEADTIYLIRKLLNEREPSPDEVIMTSVPPFESSLFKQLFEARSIHNRELNWHLKLHERKARLFSFLKINASDSVLATECMLVLIAIHKGTANTLTEVTNYMSNLLQEEQEYNNNHTDEEGDK